MNHRRIVPLTLALSLTAPAWGQEQPALAEYFGFAGMDVLPIGDDPGPMTTADMDGDGLTDLVVANNHRSRIELLRQLPADERRADAGPGPTVNAFPEHPAWDRVLIPVTNQVRAVIADDLDGDGDMDLLVAGQGGRINALVQHDEGGFTQSRHQTVRDLSASTASFVLADLEGDAGNELVSIVDGDLAWWPMDGTRIGPMRRRPAGVELVAVVPADYDGDGLTDIAGIAPDDGAPVRIWFANQDGDERTIGGQTLFDMPPLVEFEPIRLDDRYAALLGVIERPSRRIVVHAVERTRIEDEPDVKLIGFSDRGNRDRAAAVADVNDDGLLDILVADAKGSAIAVYQQHCDGGLLPAVDSPTVADVNAVAIKPAQGDRPAELIVLSSKEAFVGATPLAGERALAFPTAIGDGRGWDPEAVAVTATNTAIVRNKGREYRLQLIPHGQGTPAHVDLGALSRAPQDIVVADVDQDGHDDLLLLTPDRPMVLMLDDPDGDWTVLTKDDMPQYGLIGDGDATAMTTRISGPEGHLALFVADRNYIRSLRFDREAGWQVVAQINAADDDADLVALAATETGLVAANDRSHTLLEFTHTATGWSQADSIEIPGMEPDALLVAPLHRDSATDTILALSTDAMATITRAGNQATLREVGAWRSDTTDHTPHELSVGDVNNDGHLDIVSLDAGEQTLDILTFTDSGRLLHATGFPVFESRLFSGGSSREYQPRQAWITDTDGDGADDIVLLVHDRLVLYTQ